jgi:hypothetical protein
MRTENNQIYGLYQAIIEDNKDPQNRGRVKVRILGIHTGDTPNAFLPWAEPLQPFGGRDGNVNLYVPPIGSTVIVGFINNNPNRPIIVSYYRPQNFAVYKDYSVYKDEKNSSFFQFQTGSDIQSPSYYLDGKRKKIGLKGGSSIIEIDGDSVNLFSSGGDSSLNLTPIYLNLSTLWGGINFTPTGASIENRGTITINSSQRTIISVGNNFGIFNNILNYFGLSNLDNKNIISQSLEGIFGNDLLNLIKNTLNQASYDPSKTLLVNILSIYNQNVDYVQSIIQKVPTKYKGFVSKILSLKGSKNFIYQLIFKGFEYTKNFFSNTLNSVFNFGGTNFVPSFALIVNGTGKISFSGKTSLTFSKKQTGMFLDTASYTFMNDLNYKITNNWSVLSLMGDFNFTLSKGNVSYNLMMGKMEIKFTNPMSKLSVKKSLPTPPKADSLVKKEAFNKLFSYIIEIANYLATHSHIGNMGAPTTPPLSPYPFFPKKALYELQINVLKSMPAPLNVFFTNNFEAS